MDAKEVTSSGITEKQGCQARDLACGSSAILLWYLPILALFVGLSWAAARTLLWIPAFLVMGVACLVNAARCGRLHCFVTGPIYLLAAVYVALAAIVPLPLHPGILLTVVLGITILACCIERPLGTYKKA